jgi:hypothetical protein
MVHLGEALEAVVRERPCYGTIEHNLWSRDRVAQRFLMDGIKEIVVANEHNLRAVLGEDRGKLLHTKRITEAPIGQDGPRRIDNWPSVVQSELDKIKGLPQLCEDAAQDSRVAGGLDRAADEEDLLHVVGWAAVLDRASRCDRCRWCSSRRAMGGTERR